MKKEISFYLTGGHQMSGVMDIARELWLSYVEMVKTGNMDRLDRITDFTSKGGGERVAMSWLLLPLWKMREASLRGMLERLMESEDDEYRVVASSDPVGDVLNGKLPVDVDSRSKVYDFVKEGWVSVVREGFSYREGVGEKFRKKVWGLVLESVGRTLGRLLVGKERSIGGLRRGYVHSIWKNDLIKVFEGEGVALPSYLIRELDDLILHGDIDGFRERWKVLSEELVEGYYLTTPLR